MCLMLVACDREGGHRYHPDLIPQKAESIDPANRFAEKRAAFLQCKAWSRTQTGAKVGAACNSHIAERLCQGKSAQMPSFPSSQE